MFLRRIVLGAVGGFAATLVMSAFLGETHRRHVIQTLPPKTIVKHFWPASSEPEANAAASVAHLGYGTMAGAVFGAIPGTRPIMAVGYGLVVWAASYEGWLPLLQILPPAHRDVRPRAATMLAAHLVYGVSLGAALRALGSRDRSRR